MSKTTCLPIFQWAYRSYLAVKAVEMVLPIYVDTGPMPSNMLEAAGKVKSDRRGSEKERVETFGTQNS